MASQTLPHTLRRHLPEMITRPSPFPTTTTAPPQTRLFSNTSTLRAKVVHPDIDRYIRYSLRDGPPRTSRPKPLFSLSHQCPWPKIIPATAASASFTSAFQPTLSQRRAFSSSSITSPLDAKTLKDEEDNKELLRQMRQFVSQLKAVRILQEGLEDRSLKIDERTGILSREIERQRVVSHGEALAVIIKQMDRRSKFLLELSRRSAAGETIFTGNDGYDGSWGFTKEEISNFFKELLYHASCVTVGVGIVQIFMEVKPSGEGPRIEEVGEEDTASDSSPHRDAAKVKSEGGDEELPELQYLAKP